MEKIRKPNRSEAIDKKSHLMGIDTGIMDKNGKAILTGDYVKYCGKDCIILYSTFYKKFCAYNVNYAYCAEYDLYNENTYYVFYTDFSNGSRMECELVSHFKKPIPKQFFQPKTPISQLLDFLKK